MTLTSLSFGIFVLIALLLYYIMPKKHRWIVLLLASISFYVIICFKYISYIVITIITTYVGARIIERMQKASKEYVKAHKEEWTKEEKTAYKNKATGRRKLVLAGFLLLNFGILCFLKYFNFLAGSIASLLSVVGISIHAPNLGLVLPLGISFYTFQSMGYIIDVYRQKVPAEKNLAKFALFVSFFPQIIQGPIGIYDKLANQLYEGHELSYDNLKYGFQLVLWGLAKKLVIADRAVILINTVCADTKAYSGSWMLLTVCFYALQLYADFSGGVDISRGVAQMFGIDMAENFKRPYFSRSLGEYWRRWHITLGAWLKDYLFYPIAMSSAFLKLGKKTKARFGNHVGKVLPASIATFITFVVIGIWHGANNKYVAFGVWNGAVLFASNMLEPVFKKLLAKLRINAEWFIFRVFQMLRTFVLVLIGYYFDIAKDFSEAMNMMYRSVANFKFSDLKDAATLESVGLIKWDYLLLLFGMMFIFFVSLYQEITQNNVRERLSKAPAPIRWGVMVFGTLFILVFGLYGPGVAASEFVYMQF